MRIVIIGAQAAGLSAAAKAKRMAKDNAVVVYEKSNVVSFGACGLPYFVGGFFDDENRMVARTANQLRESGLELKTGHEVLKVDAAGKKLLVRDLATGDTFEDAYDRLMIATGASPIMPPIENAGLANVFMLKTMEDGFALKKAAQARQNQEVVIIGAGFIGLEAVEAMLKLGNKVRVIQLDARVLPDTFDSEVTTIMEQELRNHGVEVQLGESVKALTGETAVAGVVTDKGEYKADIVVVCTGVRPNTAFLKDTGIEMLRNGALIIDEYGKTSLDNIFAAGDCATVDHLIRQEKVFIPLATTANKIGRLIGENLVGGKSAFPGTLGSAALKVLDLEAGRTGLTENEASKLGLNYKTVFVTDKNQTDYYPGQAAISVKLVYHAETRQILGGQIIGKNGAVLRVDVLAAAVFSKLTLGELGMLDLCYAPPFARTWDVLNVAANAAK